MKHALLADIAEKALHFLPEDILHSVHRSICLQNTDDKAHLPKKQLVFYLRRGLHDVSLAHGPH